MNMARTSSNTRGRRNDHNGSAPYQSRLSDVKEDPESYPSEDSAEYPLPPPPHALESDLVHTQPFHLSSDALYGETDKKMPRVETEDEIDDDGTDAVPLYESYWAQNTTAHGVSRIANTKRWHRVIWILALLGCFIYMSYEVYNSFTTYRLYLTTTEINKRNSEQINFPSVTFCNFNRWRKTHLTDDVLKELTKVLSFYSYDYVIPEINDGANPDTLDLQAVVNPQPTLKPTMFPATTTEPPPVVCNLPDPPPMINYEIQGNATNGSTVLVNTNIRYFCVDSGRRPRDGDIIHTCSDSGQFVGRLPICVNIADVGRRFTLINNQSDPRAMAVSDKLNSSYHPPTINEMTLCFWIRIFRTQHLSTLLSYGFGDETILSITSILQSQLPTIYGVKYRLFGVEGRAITLTGYDQWNPFCVQYSTDGLQSQLFKFLVLNNRNNGFQPYGTDVVSSIRQFPLQGNIVLFNEYQSYVNLLAGVGMERQSAGGQISNVNMWSRVIPIEIMNNMLWHGDIYSMNQQTVRVVSGSVGEMTFTFNVSVSQDKSLSIVTADDLESLRVKRQAEPTGDSEGVEIHNITLTTTTMEPRLNTTTTSLNSTTPNTTASSNSTDTQSEIEETLKAVFNYANFTKTAGWQLVDDHSISKPGEPGEPRTLLKCVYRGKQCDSRWFTHRFGAYGNCYTFNQDIPQPLADEEEFRLPLIQDNSGPTGGLNLLLDIQTWEYSESPTLNGNSELGVKFIVHAPYEVPVINSMGYAVGPGQKAFIGFTKTTITNLHDPWGKCDPNRKLQYYTKYTLDGCSIECKLEKVVAVCGCKPYYYPGDYVVCDFQLLATCAYLEIAKVNANFADNCKCPIACQLEEYDVKLSYTAFPNQPYGRQLGEQLNITLPNATIGIPAYDSKAQYIRGNVVSLDLYFESMSETFMSQNKAMDDTALLSNIGGQLGLFIGCSFLTALEFLECIFMSTVYHCKRSNAKKKHKKKEWLTGQGDAELGNGDPKYVDRNQNSNNNGALYTVSEPKSSRLEFTSL